MWGAERSGDHIEIGARMSVFTPKVDNGKGLRGWGTTGTFIHHSGGGWGVTW